MVGTASEISALDVRIVEKFAGCIDHHQGTWRKTAKLHRKPSSRCMRPGFAHDDKGRDRLAIQIKCVDAAKVALREVKQRLTVNAARSGRWSWPCLYGLSILCFQGKKFFGPAPDVTGSRHSPNEISPSSPSPAQQSVVARRWCGLTAWRR